MDKLKVALVAGSMPHFSDEGPRLYARHAAALEQVAGELGFDLTVYADLVLSEQQAAEVRKELDAEGVDLVLLFHPTFMVGDLTCELMKTRAAFGLWAVEEPSRDGPLPLASFVCLNQNASMAAHYFGPGERKVKWFFGSTDGTYFKRRFEITIRALAAIKDLRDAKVAQIGKVADGFRDMYYDERAVYRTLGVDVVRGIEIEDVLGAADAVDPALVETEAAKVRRHCAGIEVADAKIVESVKIYLAVKRLCDEHGFRAVAISCWPKLGQLRNMTACLPDALLGSSGIPAACEGDLLSAVSMLVLENLSRRPVAVMDLPAFDDEDDSVLVWHCGSAPFEMAGPGGVCCRDHYRAAFAEDTGADRYGPVTDMVYPETDMTVFRLTGESDRFLYFTGTTGAPGKPSWDGSRGWLHDLKLYRQPIRAIDLVNTILVRGFQHHYPVTFSDVSAEIEETAYWLGLSRVPRADYTDHLTPD